MIELFHQNNSGGTLKSSQNQSTMDMSSRRNFLVETQKMLRGNGTCEPRRVVMQFKVDSSLGLRRAAVPNWKLSTHS